MRTLFGIQLFILLLISPSTAASKAKAPNSRSLNSLVEQVVKTGSERELIEPLSRKLGFDSDTVDTKAVRYKKVNTPDGREHSLHVVSIEGKPSALVFTRTQVNVKNGVKHIDGVSFRCDANGKLIAAVSIRGPSNMIEQAKLDINSAPVKKDFAGELEFFTKTMAAKEFDP